MIKTIKWASRLAISAYGLHVTLVDLPETFTPSGNRFSRQTFAHLSRLHHEDVLHADIQTLDTEDCPVPSEPPSSRGIDDSSKPGAQVALLAGLSTVNEQAVY